MRAFLGGGGLILTVVGVVVSWVTLTANGWAVLAAVGVLMLWAEFEVEKVQARRARQALSRPRFESDLDHMGVQ